MAQNETFTVVIKEGTASPDRPRDRVHHTVTACVRCRQRKTRCDATLPRCEPCERSKSRCEYFDSAKNKTIPRTYITSLQETVRRLNEELKALEREEHHEADHEAMARAPGLVKFNERDDSRFLGPSSGIAITRFVMDFAKQNATRRTIRDVVSDHTAQEIKQKFDAESHKPTSKVYPLISSVAAPALPIRGLMDRLVEIYMVKAQYMLPLLHEPTFRGEVDLVCNGSTDATQNFQVRMVVAISMQKLDAQFAGLADSYYLAALPYLTEAIRKKDLSTLQCFVLIGQYSLLTPTRTAAYWVIGLAAKLSAELGLCEEQTIEKPPSGVRPNALEVDMRRRLFWIITSMEYGLSHSLGRPSAFGVSVDNINVQFFEQCDDRFITADGLLPGRHPIMKKCIAIHFFKMRLLQAEIRRTLYLKKRDVPTSDRDPWFQRMIVSIDDWVRNTPKNDEGSGLSEAWFHGRRNTMVIFMYRPSPQIPTPSVFAAHQCYEAAVFNVRLQKRQVENRLIDVTWIFTQAICMALNTILWSLSYPNIRQQHPMEEVSHHIGEALRAIELCADRWPGVRSALQLYHNLIHGCLKAYDNDKAVRSPAAESTSQVSYHDYSTTTSQAGQSPASTTGTSFYGPHSPQSHTGSHPSAVPSGHVSHSNKPVAFDTSTHLPHVTNPVFSTPVPHQAYPHMAHVSPPALGQPLPFDPSPYSDGHRRGTMPPTSQTLPSWESLARCGPDMVQNFPAWDNMSLDNQPWLASFGEEHSQFLGSSGGPMQYQMQSLNEQDQLDLMASLERSQLPDVSSLVSDAHTFYAAGLP